MIDKKLSTQINDINLKTIDTAVVDWFKKKFPISINGKNVEVIFATAERFARISKEKGLRDEKGSLILPIISIRRTNVDKHPERYIPTSNETNITYFKKISTTPISDNDRQPTHMKNTVRRTIKTNRRDTYGTRMFGGMTWGGSLVFTVTENGETSYYAIDPEYLLQSDRVPYDILQVPFPSFVNLDYEITIWTSFMSHQNIEQENIFKEFKGGKNWFYNADDYFFFGEMKNFKDESNLENFTDKEKIIKSVMSLEVQAYIIDRSKVEIYRTPSNIRINVKETSILL